ncbi:MAG TPA: hypothetical protein PLV25_06295, partial [Opitutales bacterium]|nr:hypothetical protein [Opitutales bacterium]
MDAFIPRLRRLSTTLVALLAWALNAHAQPDPMGPICDAIATGAPAHFAEVIAVSPRISLDQPALDGRIPLWEAIKYGNTYARDYILNHSFLAPNIDAIWNWMQLNQALFPQEYIWRTCYDLSFYATQHNNPTFALGFLQQWDMVNGINGTIELFRAAYLNSYTQFRYLLAFGAPYNLPHPRREYTVRDYLVELINTQMGNTLERQQMIRLLDALPHQETTEALDALLESIKTGNFRSYKTILQNALWPRLSLNRKIKIIAALLQHNRAQNPNELTDIFLGVFIEAIDTNNAQAFFTLLALGIPYHIAI